MRAATRRAIESDGTRIVVVDDDPTGTQTVRDVPLVTSLHTSDLEWSLHSARPTCAVLTNSRSLDEREAVSVNLELGERLGEIAQREGVPIRAISRSDSILRGHFPAEPEALARGLERAGMTTDCILLCPAYPEAGRISVDDVHWVRQGSRFVPAADTEFARDPAFGYHSSNLREWVRERAGHDATVTSISIDDIRIGGPAMVAQRVAESVGNARYVIANAIEPADLDALALGAQLAEQQGVRLIYRTGPSFVSARAGRGTAEPLSAHEIASPAGRGLIVVGSHTALTSIQLDRAQAKHDFKTVWLNAPELVDEIARNRVAVIARAVSALHDALATGDAALVTTRAAVQAGHSAQSLQIAAAVGEAVVEITRTVATDTSIDWLVAKGGITSHDVAAKALGARRATVLGQLFPGKVSVWELRDGSIRPGLRYVVFPGNVGDEMTLAQTLDRLKGWG